MAIEAPIGTEIAAALLVILASVLAIIAKRVMADHTERHPPLPSDKTQVDLQPVLSAIEGADRRVREVTVVAHRAGERLDQHERQLAQLIQSLNDNMARAHREKEIEDRRQFERILDKIDRLRNGHG